MARVANTELTHVHYPVQAVGAPEGVGSELLVMREIGEATKEAVCKRLSQLEPNSVLELDFRGIRFLDVSCADEVVVKVLARLQAGEYPERFVVLSHIGVQHEENIDAALNIAGKSVVVREASPTKADKGADWRLLGHLVDTQFDALSKVMELGAVTARELQEAMEYRTVNEASTKLVALYQQCLVARAPYRLAVRGGGRQFRYLSLV